MQMRVRVFVPVLIGASACAFAATAAASGSAIALKGPHANKYGNPFQYKASGRTSGSANYVYGWEVTYTPACASTYKSESKRSRKSLFVSKSLQRNRRFSFAIEFLAANLARHRFCAYVIEKASGKTLARAETTWRNYASGLQPAPLGSGECQPKRFPDDSVYAQVVISGITCETFESAAYGADGARGAAYNSAGFTCTPTTQGAGSMWASAWTGTYYSYSCVSGHELAAFNWGMQYASEPASALPLVRPGG